MQETTFWTIPLIVHLLLAVTLLGAITHQAVAVLVPVRKPAGDFVTRFRSVAPTTYATAVAVLFLATALLGSSIYVKYRVYVRIPMEQFGSWKIVAAFDGKEHVIAIGAALLPAYWYFWRREPPTWKYAYVRKWLTVMLALIVWYAFLIGHLANKVRGFGS